MRFSITSRGFKLTPSIGVYAKDKIAKLFGRLFKISSVSEAIFVDIVISRTTHHHRKGLVWKADVDIILPQSKRPVYAEATSEDIRASIDILSEEIERELLKYKGRATAMMKRGARVAKKEIRLDPAARLYRKGRIRNEGN